MAVDEGLERRRAARLGFRRRLEATQQVGQGQRGDVAATPALIRGGGCCSTGRPTSGWEFTGVGAEGAKARAKGYRDAES